MAIDLNNISPFYGNNLLAKIASELKKEKKDIEELSYILEQLVNSFNNSSKSDISNPVKLKLKLKILEKNYRKIFFDLIMISVNESQKGSFITLDYDKIYYLGDSDQIKNINSSYKNILQSRGEDGDFTEREFKNFITKCANTVNEIASVVIIKPNSDLMVKAVDIMNIEEPQD